MVVRVVNGDTGGNLDYADDFFGVEDDRIVVQVTGSYISTFAGNDLVDATRGTSLQYAYLGYGNDTYYGGTGADAVYDGDGNDFLTLGNGADYVYAGAGNDTFIGGAGIDIISFAGESYNGVGSSVQNVVGVTFDLMKTTAQNLGVLGVDTVTGFENVYGTYGHDKIYGTAEANALTGYGGSDLLDGRAGNDVLEGFDGKDLFIGGAGADNFHFSEGILARDIARYTAITESGTTGASRDVFWGFDPGTAATDDRIDLSLIDADPYTAGNQAFTWLGTGAFTSKIGEVRIKTSDGDTHVYVDADKDVDMDMLLLIENVVGITKGDFIL